MLDLPEMPDATAGDIEHFLTQYNSTLCLQELYLVEGINFAGRFKSARLGAVDVFRFDGQGIRGGMRDVHHIRSNPTDDFMLLLPAKGSIEISQRRNRTVIDPGSFAFLSTNEPWDAYCGKPPYPPYCNTFAKVPGALLRNQLPQVDNICALSVSSETAAGRVMCSVIELVLADGSMMSSTQAMIMGSVLSNAISAAASDVPELRGQQRSCEQYHEEIRLKALAFIESNLSDPELDRVRIARHCHVSLRHLHACFGSSSIAIAAHIREMRLQRCRAELTNPTLRYKSIIEIAMNWGFSSSASFTRAYKRRFGIAPSEERPMAARC